MEKPPARDALAVGHDTFHNSRKVEGAIDSDCLACLATVNSSTSEITCDFSTKVSHYSQRG